MAASFDEADDQRPRTRPPLLRSFRYGVSGGLYRNPSVATRRAEMGHIASLRTKRPGK